MRLLRCLYMVTCSFSPLLERDFPGATTAEWADSGCLGLPGLSPFFGPPRVGFRKAPAVMEMLWIREAVF